MPTISFVDKALPSLLAVANVQSRDSVVCVVAYKPPAYDIYVYTSVDGGSTWVETSESVFPGGNCPTTWSILANGTIVGGNDDGFSISTSGGLTWGHVDRLMGAEPNARASQLLSYAGGTKALGWHPGYPYVWRIDSQGWSQEGLPSGQFVVHDTGTRLVLLFTDGATAGQVWSSSYTGVFNLAFTIPSFNPTTYSNITHIGDTFVSGGGVVLVQATDAQVGFARSTDGGATWAASGAVSFGLGRFFYNESESAFYGRVTDNRIVKSLDGGLTWADVGTQANWAEGFVEAGGLLYSSADVVVPTYVQWVPHTSSDYGASWTRHEDEAPLRFYAKQNSGKVAYWYDSSGDDVLIYKEAVVFEPAGGDGAYSLPPFSVFGFQSASNSGAFNLPTLTLSATGAVDPRYVYTLDYAGVSSVAPTSSGLMAALALSNASAVFTTEVDALVAATAISSALAASVLASQTIAGATAISLVWLDVAQPGLALADVWAMNAETGGFTRYEGFDFNSYAKIGGAYFGCKEDGIYQLDGQTDAGLPIRSMVSFGKQDFGNTALKRITNAYVGVSGEGRLFLKVMGEGQEYTYAARSYDEALQVQRFDTGKGLRVNWLEFELYNADGEDFELASVEFAVVPTSRRI